MPEIAIAAALSARPAPRLPRRRCTSDATFKVKPTTLSSACTVAIRRSSPIRSRQSAVPVTAAGSAPAMQVFAIAHSRPGLRAGEQHARPVDRHALHLLAHERRGPQREQLARDAVLGPPRKHRGRSAENQPLAGARSPPPPQRRCRVSAIAA